MTVYLSAYKDKKEKIEKLGCLCKICQSKNCSYREVLKILKIIHANTKTK